MKEQASDQKNKKLTMAPSGAETVSHRSPNYPAVSLPDAIKRVEKVHIAANTNAVDKELLSKLIGYSSANGTALKTVSALKKYGLIEETNKGLRVSEAAVSILVDPKDSVDRSNAINKAVYSPILFSDLISEFGLKLPADEVIRSFLIKRSFSRQAADVAIGNFRESIDFLQNECNSAQVQQNSDKKSELFGDLVADAMNSVSDLKIQRPVSQAEEVPSEKNDFLVYRVSKDCSVKISFSGPVTVKNIDKLIALLELNKDVYPSE